MEVYKAIAAVQGEMAEIGIKKDKENKMQGYKFRGIDDVYNALAPLLSKHGLCILPRVAERICTERQTQKGGTLFYTTVKCEFDFVSAVDDSKHTVTTYGEAMDSGDKSTNKAMSAAYKYAAFQAFCIPVDVEDADATTHEVKSMKVESKTMVGVGTPVKDFSKKEPIKEPTAPAIPKVTPEQKVAIRALMVAKGITEHDEQIKFYKFVIAEDDQAIAAEFIDKFDKAYEVWRNANE